MAGRWGPATRCFSACWHCWRRWSCPSWCKASPPLPDGWLPMRKPSVNSCSGCRRPSASTWPRRNSWCRPWGVSCKAGSRRSPARRPKRRPARRGMLQAPPPMPLWRWRSVSTCSPAKKICCTPRTPACGQRCRPGRRAVCWLSARWQTGSSAATWAGSLWMPCWWAGKPSPSCRFLGWNTPRCWQCWWA